MTTNVLDSAKAGELTPISTPGNELASRDGGSTDVGSGEVGVA